MIMLGPYLFVFFMHEFYIEICLLMSFRVTKIYKMPYGVTLIMINSLNWISVSITS